MASPTHDGTSRSGDRAPAWFNRPGPAHVVPFAVWLIAMGSLDAVGEPGAWKYAVRTLATLLAILLCRPWRWYNPPCRRAWLPGILAGTLVFLVWVLPEVGWGGDVSFPRELYLRFGIRPFGRLPRLLSTSMYDPGVCGWHLTLLRLFGSAFVIAAVEEFFWRGFLYRRLIEPNFTRISLGRFDQEAFWITVALFGLEHRRLFVGMFAGLVYGTLMIKTRDPWSAILAHMVTNLLLGIFVIASKNYAFW